MATPHFRSGIMPVISPSHDNFFQRFFVHSLLRTTYLAIMPNIQKLVMAMFGTKSASKEDDARTVSGPLGSPIRGDVEKLIIAICSFHSELQNLKDLRPSDKINTIFTDLVNACTQTLPDRVTEKVLNDERIQSIMGNLRAYCATGEYYLENHWATWIVDVADEQSVSARLEAFPYYTNYMDLTYLELVNIQAVLQGAPRRIAFIGSGPLPMSSLCILKALKEITTSAAINDQPVIVNIDQSAEAIHKSANLCERLGLLGNGMEFQCFQAESNLTDFRGFDVVYLAALVGTTQKEKKALLLTIVGRMDPGTLLVIRTAHGLRGLLYPVFNVKSAKILDCLEICTTVHPENHIVNSFVIARVKGNRNSGCEL